MRRDVSVHLVRTIFWRFFFYLIFPPSSSLLFEKKQYLATGKIENKIQLASKEM